MKQSFSVDHLVNLQRTTNYVPMNLSPDGRLLAVSVQGIRRNSVEIREHGYGVDGVCEDMDGSQIYVVDTITGIAQEPFPAESVSWGGQWAPDGSRLAAYVRLDGLVCLGVWFRETDTFQLFKQASIRTHYGFEVPRWTPDSKKIIVKLWPASGAFKPPAPDQALPPKQPPPVSVFSSDRSSGVDTRPTGAWLYDSACCDLGCIDVATGEMIRLVCDWPVWNWRVAPDGKTVAAFKLAEYDSQRYRMTYDLVVVPLDGTPPRTIASKIYHGGGGFNWSPDSQLIAFTIDDGDDDGSPKQLFVVPADGSESPRALLDAMTIKMDDYLGPHWSEDSSSIHCLTRDHVWIFNADGSNPRQMNVVIPGWRVVFWIHPPMSPLLRTSPDRALFAVVRNDVWDHAVARVSLERGEGTILTEFAKSSWDPFQTELAADFSACYLVAEAAEHPAEIWRIPFDTHVPNRLVSLNSDLAGVALGKPRLIEWRALDKQIRRGALLLPPNYCEGERIPVIVHVYPGNFSNWIHDFGFSGGHYDNAQLLASQGYAVFWPDLPIHRRNMQEIPNFVLPAVNRLIDLEIADPDRIGLMGHSAGGYCVLALLTQTDCFRTAVCSAGVVNITSDYGTMTDKGDNSHGYELGSEMGGTLWEKRDAYIENSPLFYFHRVKTPLLLVQGTEDIWGANQGKEAFSALRRLGKPVELRLYHGEGHWPGAWSERNYRDVCDRVLGWFNQYLGDPQ